jgi:hypothetical protein
MKVWLSQRPWIWILVAFLLFVLANIILLMIARRHPAIPA